MIVPGAFIYAQIVSINITITFKHGVENMICPICGKDIRNREFYDHMGEYHGWSLSEAEIYADERYLEEHPELRSSDKTGEE